MIIFIENSRLTVYHGSPKKFNSFSIDYLGSSTQVNTNSLFFTTNKDFAISWMEYLSAINKSVDQSPLAKYVSSILGLVDNLDKKDPRKIASSLIGITRLQFPSVTIDQLVKIINEFDNNKKVVAYLYTVNLDSNKIFKLPNDNIPKNKLRGVYSQRGYSGVIYPISWYDAVLDKQRHTCSVVMLWDTSAIISMKREQFAI